jgi:hypothetical protein
MFKTYRSSTNFEANFFHGKVFVLTLTKMGWATFWAIFSRTYLVTLATNPAFTYLGKRQTR